MRLGKARVGCTLKELIDRAAMAISGVEVAPGIDGHPEWVYLPTGVGLQASAIWAIAVSITRIHFE